MINQFDWAEKWATYRPEKTAFKEYETGQSLTFDQLNRLGNQLAHQMSKDYGLSKGDRIAIIAENCLTYLVLFVAAQKTGCILVPLNYRLTSAEIDYLLDNADPRWLIVESKFRAKASATQAWKDIPFKSALEEVVNLKGNKLEQVEDQAFQKVAIQPNDPIFILYTSGTTGFPKGALYTHQMLFWNSINTALSLSINAESCTVNCMPPFHTGGWNVLTTPFFHHGGYSCLMKSFDPQVVLQVLEKEQVTIFMGVPTMLKMIAALPEFETANLSSLHYIIVGGEPMPIPLIEQWHSKGVPIRQGYGMTEVGPNLSSLHQKDAIRKMGSIGRPNFYVEIRIVDEQHLECPTNQAGELLLRGPMVTPGYWKNEAATQKAFHHDWFKTGDRVRQDEEGYLFVVDRIKNMFISGGENVYPAEIERVLLAHPKISEAAVVAMPDEKWGESGKAFIVAQEALTAAEIKTYCSAQLAKFKVPKSVVFLQELPKNDTGKINRKVLKEG
ncbi:MAG: long-chain fatty acid--CoA ligase [Bacteroidota bacterium]